MPLSIIRTVDAASEPLSLTEAKDHLRVDDTNSDTLITSEIVTARNVVEKLTGRQLLTATYQYVLDSFPGQWNTNARFAGPIVQVEGGPLFLDPRRWCDSQIIKVPTPPLQSVSSIVYIDTAGSTQTLSAGSYVVDAISQPGRIGLASGSAWPTTQNRINAVTITYVAGWTTGTIGAEVKHLMRLMVSDYYENRVPSGSANMGDYSFAAQSLMSALDFGDYR